MNKLTFANFLKILTCLLLLISFAGCSSSKKNETPGQYVDDSIITTKVKKAIFDEPTLKTREISVKTNKGIVQLSGFVDSSAEVNKAGDVAKNVENVQSVENDLIVRQ